MILVVGSTGLVGSMIAEQLLERKLPVRILVRPQSNYQHLVEKGAESFIGDLKDRASLNAACQGVASVITTANAARRSGEDTIETVDIQGNRNLIDAAKQAKVGHFVFISALNANSNSPSPFLSSRGLTETYLRESGLNYTILAANVVLDFWIGLILGRALKNGSPVAIIGQGKRKHTFVAAKDIAAFSVAVLNNPTAQGKTLQIGGPEALSWLDIASIARRTLKKELAVQTYAPGDPEAVVGLPTQAGSRLNNIMAHLDTFDSPLDMSELANTFGIRQTFMEELLPELFTENLAP